uniref:FAD-binding domain-containing protein n=1 Tax=Aegilops tauschii TaxID=37682 RepID=R7WFC3_AEGTA
MSNETFGVRPKHIIEQRPRDSQFQVTNLENGATQVFRFAGRENSGEIKARPADRKALLEALAEELPPGTIRFSSKLVSIDSETTAEEEGSPETSVLRLDDGTVIRAKVVIGCDGVHSVVARWLGLSEPVTCGRSAVRGLAVYPDGHGMKRELRQFLSAGLRASMVPISETEVYWFLVNNTVAAAEEEAGADPAKSPRSCGRFIFPKLADTLWYDCGDLVPPQSKEKGKNHLE